MYMYIYIYIYIYIILTSLVLKIFQSLKYLQELNFADLVN